MKNLRRIPTFLIAMLLAFTAVLVCADVAYAIGDGTVGSFSCSGGKASGKLYDSGASCPTSLNMSNIFSFLVCNINGLKTSREALIIQLEVSAFIPVTCSPCFHLTVSRAVVCGTAFAAKQEGRRGHGITFPADCVGFVHAFQYSPNGTSQS